IQHPKAVLVLGRPFAAVPRFEERGWHGREGREHAEDEPRQNGRYKQTKPGAAQPPCGPRPGSAPAPHQRPVTVMVLAPVRPNTSGAYIASARVGGATNVPRELARARYR